MKLFTTPLIKVPARRRPTGKNHGQRGLLPPVDAGVRQRSKRRLEKSPFVTNALEIHRLRQKLATIENEITLTAYEARGRLNQMKLDCQKAIAALALLKESQ
jgi:hypothetical protein